MFPSSFDQDLTGYLLAASPLLGGTNFAQSLIYICRHSIAEGAMGMVINRPLLYPPREEIFQQLQIPFLEEDILEIGVGGPVEVGRGFILHSSEWQAREAIIAKGKLASVNASVDILKEISEGHGPKAAMLLLGHAGWAPQQLENEIYKENAWYVVPPTSDLIFKVPRLRKWENALKIIGIEPAFLSLNTGNS